MESKKFINEVSFEIIGSAIEVHKIMVRGLLESVYQTCMQEEMEIRGLTFLNQFTFPVNYKNESLVIDFRCDFFVEDCVVVELKAVQEMIDFFDAQVLTHMNLLKAP